MAVPTGSVIDEPEMPDIGVPGERPLPCEPFNDNLTEAPGRVTAICPIPPSPLTGRRDYPR